jgi:hypothetical protein
MDIMWRGERLAVSGVGGQGVVPVRGLRGGVHVTAAERQAASLLRRQLKRGPRSPAVENFFDAHVASRRNMPALGANMRCPYCGADPQPVHDDVPIPVCCEKAQREALFGRPEDLKPAKKRRAVISS